MKYCGKCGQPATDDSMFCETCGNPFSTTNKTSAASIDYQQQQSNPETAPGFGREHTFYQSANHAQAPNTPAPPLKPEGRRKLSKGMIAALISLVLLFTAGGAWGWWKLGTEARAQAKLDLAVKYLSENNYEQAILAFNDAIKIDPKQVKSYQGLAKTYTLQRRYDEAKAAYERGTAAVKPEHQLILRLSLAGMYIDKGDLAQAEAFFQEIIKGNKTCIDAYLGLAMVYQQQGSKEKVLTALEQCIKENSQNYRAYNAAARYYADNKDKDKTLSYIVKSLDLEVNQDDAYIILSDVYKGNWEVLQSKADNTWAAKTAAMLKFYAYYSDQKYAQALSLYHSSLEQDKNNLKAAILASICMFNNGEKEQAAQLVKDIATNTNSDSIIVDLIRYYIIAGDAPRAREMAVKSLDQKPDNLELIKLLASIDKSDTSAIRTYQIWFIVGSWDPVNVVEKEIKKASLELPFPESQKPLSIDYYIPDLNFAYKFKTESHYRNDRVTSVYLTTWEKDASGLYVEKSRQQDTQYVSFSDTTHRATPTGVFMVKTEAGQEASEGYLEESVGSEEKSEIMYVAPQQEWTNNYQLRQYSEEQWTENHQRHGKYLGNDTIQIMGESMEAAHVQIVDNVSSDYQQGFIVKEETLDLWLVKNTGVVRKTSHKVFRDGGTSDFNVELIARTSKGAATSSSSGQLTLEQKKEKAREILFSYKPSWREEEKKGRQYTGNGNSHQFCIEADWQPDRNGFLFHVYDSVDYPQGGHTATLGWYLVKPDTGEIWDDIMLKRVK
ncbi:MAG: tetratricopeptide repeat protein [Syntrophomonadaceae bacterium]